MGHKLADEANMVRIVTKWGFLVRVAEAVRGQGGVSRRMVRAASCPVSCRGLNASCPVFFHFLFS